MIEMASNTSNEPEKVVYKAEYITNNWTSHQISAAIQAAEEVGYKVEVGDSNDRKQSLILSGNGIDNVRFLTRMLELSKPTF